MNPRWWSQPFHPDGSVTSDGMVKQLGMPELDPLTVMLRETAQNSWDARRDEDEPIRIRYSIGTLGNRAASWRQLLLPFDTVDPRVTTLSHHLRPESHYLLVSDRGTVGLGGPVRSDVDGQPRDFVDFVRNSGQRRDHELGGGTYGFGKGSLFRISRPGVILIDTVCIDGGRPQRRLIGSALGLSHERDGRRYTGRHWWGNIRDDVPDPLLEDEADVAAELLGLELRNDGPGTDIWILGVNLGENDDGTPRTALQAAEVLAASAAWYLWPKLIDRPARGPVIDIEVDVEGVPVAVPNPASEPRLLPFVEALRKIDAGEGARHTRRTAPTHLGDFALHKELWFQPEPSALDSCAPFSGRAHHCARMRPVELVVDYFPGPEPADPNLQYGAVYRASVEANNYFADAEPPTHHDWITTHLTGTSKGVVTGARRYIAQQMNEAVRDNTSRGQATTAPLGQLSRALARILPLASGDGADHPEPRPGGGGGRRSGRVIKTIGRPTVRVRDGVAYVAQQVRVEPSSDPVTAVGEAQVAVDGGTEREAPTGAETPTIHGWEPAHGGELRLGPELTIGPADPRDWILLAVPARDTATVVRVREKDRGGAS